MKKLIDIDGLKIFMARVKEEIDRNVKMLTNAQNGLFDGVYQIIGWTDKNQGFYNHLSNHGLNSNSILDALSGLKSELGKTDAEVGTDSAFARIKKLETTTITADDLATSTDMNYLFDLYVNHDASTISTENKRAIVYTYYMSEENKPDYLD